MNKILAIVITILTVTGLFLGSYACAPALAPEPEPTPTSTLTLDIGVAAPLTGDVASLGTQMKNGILLAIEDQNNQGGVTIAGQKYMLNSIILDTKSDVKEGKSVAEQLVYSKKVKVIMGPSILDAIGAQPVLEANKVIGIYLQPIIPGMSNTDKPYSFFSAGPILQFYDIVIEYIVKFYPEAKTVVSVMPQLPDGPMFTGPVQTMCDRYGLKWLGVEQFPITTQDFSPLIARMLAQNPDIVDTASTGGSMGAVCSVLMKQLREAGFKGIIMVPAAPPASSIAEIVPEQYRTKIVINDANEEGSIVPASYRDLMHHFVEKFKKPPYNITPKIYNVAKGFLQFLDGQETMDTTVWMEGFAKYRWMSPWGDESFFSGKPIWGINRMCLGPNLVSEYINGKYETNWKADLPMELYYSE